MKNTLLFTYSTNILLRLLTVNLKNCLTPKNQETVRPHSSNSIWKMLPHHSHSSCENATPFSGTFPLAFYKEVQPPPDRAPTRNLRFGLFHQSNSSCQYLASIPATCKYTDKKGKQQLNSHERLRIVVVSGLLLRFRMLRVNSHCRFTIFLGILQLIEWIRQLATYLFIFRPLWRKFSCRKLPAILLSLLTAVSSTAN